MAWKFLPNVENGQPWNNKRRSPHHKPHETLVHYSIALAGGAFDFSPLDRSTTPSRTPRRQRPSSSGRFSHQTCPSLLSSPHPAQPRAGILPAGLLSTFDCGLGSPTHQFSVPVLSAVSYRLILCAENPSSPYSPPTIHSSLSR